MQATAVASLIESAVERVFVGVLKEVYLKSFLKPYISI
jgi:hypothetical protein